MLLDELLAQVLPIETDMGLDRGPLESYAEGVNTVSMEGLMDRIKGLFDTSPKVKTLDSLMGSREHKRLAYILRRTLADRRWVEDRFISGRDKIPISGKGALYQLDGKVLTPPDVITHIEKKYRPAITSIRKHAGELDAAIVEIKEWVEKIVLRDDVGADKVMAAVNKAISEFEGLKRPIERVKLDAVSMPGNRAVVVKNRLPDVIVKPAIINLKEVNAPTIDDIVMVGKWVADNILNYELTTLVFMDGLDHSDGSEFNSRLSDINDYAAEKFYDVFYHQRLDDLHDGLSDWYDHIDYCEFAIRWCMRSLNQDK